MSEKETKNKSKILIGLSIIIICSLLPAIYYAFEIFIRCINHGDDIVEALKWAMAFGFLFIMYGLLISISIIFCIYTLYTFMKIYLEYKLFSENKH